MKTLHSKKMHFTRLAVIAIVLVAVMGMTTACGGGGAVAGALVGGIVGAGIGSTFDDCHSYSCDPYYYKPGDPGYDDTW